MARSEPALVPEWYKAANSGASSSTPSTHSDGHGSGSSSRNRLDAPRASLFADGSSSGSVKDSHAYSSFGKSRRDKERERERELELRGREKPSLVDNGLDDFLDFFKASSVVRLRRSHSMESWTKKPGSDTRNSVLSMGKSSFEREFPSLRGEERQRDPPRMTSPGITCPLIGGDGWKTSALVDVPAIRSPSSTTGLNMAEALVQVPSRARTPPQLSVDTQRIEELAIRQSKQLIPVTPSMPKTLVLNSLEKSKSKGARGDLKSGYSSSSQSVNHHLLRTPPPPPRSDIPKTTHQAGNFQVLNRDNKSVISPTTTKDAPSTSRAASSPASPLKSPFSPNLKRPLGQAQKRIDFFNSLRKKTSINSMSAASSSESEKPGEQSSGIALNSGLYCSVENGNGADGGSSCSVDDEEEAAFLRSLGWKEDAGEEALTAEEIDAFLKEYEKRRLSQK